MIIYIITACNIHKHDLQSTALYNRMCKTIGTIDINNIKNDKNMMDILYKYIGVHPKYNTFVIMEIPIAKLGKESSTGIFIGPGYESIYDDIYCGKVLDTINFKKTRTYIISYRHNNETIIDCWQNTNPKDSIIIRSTNNRISYYAYDNFLWRALYIYKQDKNYRIIDRLDTVMFVKEVPSSIHFSSPK